MPRARPSPSTLIPTSPTEATLAEPITLLSASFSLTPAELTLTPTSST